MLYRMYTIRWWQKTLFLKPSYIYGSWDVKKK